MTWREALLSLQIAAEERVGSPARRALLQARAEEDAIHAHNIGALSGPPR